MGPIVLFDKSAIEMMNVDEAAIFDCLYGSNLCPIYYVEVLADLQKAETSGRSHVKVVADMARKTPVMHSYPNVHHAEICLQELLGYSIDLRRAPVVGGGRPVKNRGKIGIIYDESPTSKAFQRWQDGRFLEVEHLFVRAWREKLKSMQLAELSVLVRDVLSVRASPRTLEDAFTLAKEAVQGRGQRYRTLKFAYTLLGLDQAFSADVVARWKANGGPPLTDYAPYTAHCLLVDVFFYIAIEKRLISPDRPSNKTDMAYLYYLPFAMVFTSNDKLHRRTVPLFLNDNQAFLPASDLKKDLQALDRFYSELPEEIMKEGLFKNAEKALAQDFLVTRLYKQFGHRVQEPAPRPSSDAGAKALMEAVKEFSKLAKSPTNALHPPPRLRDADQVMMQRMIPIKRGKWQFLPEGVKPSDDDG